MSGKREPLRYGPTDKPPWRVTAFLGLQHAGLALVFLIYAVAAANGMGLDADRAASFLTACIAGMAVAALLQTLPPPWGSGSLVMSLPSPLMMPVTIQAGLVGGAGLVAGITVLMAATVVALARALRYLRVLFPAEVCGVVIMMLGISIASPALKNATGASFGPDGLVGTLSVPHMLVAACTMLVIILVTVFAHGPLKRFALAIGLLTGVLLSLAAGMFGGPVGDQLAQAPWFGLPHLAPVVPSLDASLVPVVIVLAVFKAIDNMGVLIGIQRMVDPDWEKIDTRQCAGGLQATSVGDVTSALLGGMAGGISAANVGLVFATSAASRIAGVVAAGLLLLAAFMPKVVALMMLLPQPVVGGIMVYTAANMLWSGMELVQSRMASDRRILTVGLAILAGLLPLILPGYYGKLSPIVAPLFKSSLAISALVAVVLNLLFRIGISRQDTVLIARNRKGHWDAGEFLERVGRQWGARHDVVRRATQAAGELVELAGAAGVKSDMRLSARFDEMNLDLWVDYDGPELVFPQALDPAQDEFGEGLDPAAFAGFIIRRLADQLTQTTDGVHHRLFLRFEH